MGIFEAEARRHTDEEDVLTSSVFGILEILDKTKFLAPVLKQCGVELAQEATPQGFNFSYWRKRGKRKPDVILDDKRTLIFFENKLNTSLGVRQLVEEYEDGIGCHKNFRLIAVTSDWVEPPEIQQAKELLTREGIENPKIQWVNWQDIYAILRSNDREGNQIEKKLIQDLLRLLEVKGLRSFDKFDREQLKSVTNLYPKWAEFLDECSACLETLRGRLERKKFSVEKPYTYPKLKHNYIAIDAWDETWVKDKKGDVKKYQYLTVFFHLYTSPEPMELIAGYFLNFEINKKIGRKLRKTFSKKVMGKSCTLIDRLKEKEYSVICYSGGEEAEIVLGEELSKGLFSQETLEKFTEIGFGLIFSLEDSLEEMTSPKLLDKIESCLVDIRDMIKKNGLFFEV